MINVILYDDNETFRQSINLLIKSMPDIELLVGMPNAETIEVEIKSFAPDVILMDIDMPNIDGVTAVNRIRKINASIPIIMLTVFDDNENIFKAIYAGADGYILKRYAETELQEAIKMVLSGGAPMTGSIARKVLQMLPKAKSKNEDAANLTQKETIILQMMVQGYSYKMIASELNNSIDTIRFHIKNIYNKLHVHSATAAVTKAINNKLI